MRALLLALLLSCVHPSAEKENCYCAYEKLAANCFCRHTNTSKPEEQTVMLADICRANSKIEHLVISHLDRLQNLSEGLRFDSAHCDWKRTTRLTLGQTNLKQLAPSSFINFPNLMRLNLSHNPQLNTYGEGAFQVMGTCLSSLVATSNPVRSLTRNVFRGMTVLKKLVLSDNKIGYIESGVFSTNCCENLRELRLDQNILTVLGADSFSGLGRLEILDLRNNPIQQLDSGVFSPISTALVELRMSHDDKTVFGGFHSPPTGLFSQLSRLTWLQMDELKIENVSRATFEGLDSLQTLSLRGNRLIQLPSVVFSALRQLTHLDLSTNRLVCIPSSLNAGDPVDFLSGLNLQTVDLSWNRLTHLNHLTARSLGLFDYQASFRTMFTLNLTGNPWQQIDDDTFCNPVSSTLMRPTNIILGPLPPVSPGLLRSSLGLWRAGMLWPNGPLALIGESSRIYGLMLNDRSTARIISVTGEEIGTPMFKTAVLGSVDAVQLCRQLRMLDYMNETSKNNSPSSVRPASSETKKHSAMAIAFSLSSHCPRLNIHELEDWELSELNVTNILGPYNFLIDSSPELIEQGSRFYLLIIAAVCVSFLLLALTVIMCYRTWSRQMTHKVDRDDLEGFPTAFTLENQHEKELLLNNSHIAVVGTDRQVVRKIGNGNAVSSEHSEMNALTDVSTGSNPLPVSTIRTSTVIFPPTLRCSNRNDRPKSDSDAADLDEAGQLTSLGVV